MLGPGRDVTHVQNRCLNVYSYKPNTIMKTKTLLAGILMLGFFATSCKDSAKEQAAVEKQVKAIESVEQAVDSTTTVIKEKAEEVDALIKELDSI